MCAGSLPSTWVWALSPIICRCRLVYAIRSPLLPPSTLTGKPHPLPLSAPLLESLICSRPKSGCDVPMPKLIQGQMLDVEVPPKVNAPAWRPV